MNNLKLLLLAIISFFIFSSTHAQVTAPKFTGAQLHQDFELFVRALKEAHPGLYRYTSKAELESLFAKTKSQIRDGMTEEEFYKLLMPVIVEIRCGHTKWFRKDRADDRYAFYNDQLFPLKLYFIDDKAYIVGDYSGNSNVDLKAEVLAINGKSIPVIRDQINRYLPTDGYVQSALNEELNHYFSGYFATFVDHQPTYRVTLKKGPEKVTKTFPGVDLHSIQKAEQHLKPVSQAPLRLEYLEQNTAMLTISRFFTGENEPDYYAFIDSTFLDLKQKGVKNLIIDVRNNEGGEESYGGYLYSYLASEEFQYYQKITVAQKERVTFLANAAMPAPYEEERKKFVVKDGNVQWLGHPYLTKKSPQPNAFKGKVYVLTNGLSFSVTSEFASVAHHNKRATFIGDETGGAYYGDNSGVFAIVTLPNTKLGMGIPLLGFYSNVSGYPHRDRGIIPDHIIKAGVDDIIDGNDAVLNYTLQLISKR
jgi:hypothetical protein